MSFNFILHLFSPPCFSRCLSVTCSPREWSVPQPEAVSDASFCQQIDGASWWWHTWGFLEKSSRTRKADGRHSYTRDHTLSKYKLRQQLPPFWHWICSQYQGKNERARARGQTLGKSFPRLPSKNESVPCLEDPISSQEPVTAARGRSSQGWQFKLSRKVDVCRGGSHVPAASGGRCDRSTDGQRCLVVPHRRWQMPLLYSHCKS